MTHKQLWTEIANAYGTPYKDRTERQKRMTKFGLCHAVMSCKCSSYGSIINLGQAMLHGYWYPVRSGLSGFPAWESIKKYDNYRANFASMMATLSFKEFKEFAKIPKNTTFQDFMQDSWR